MPSTAGSSSTPTGCLLTRPALHARSRRRSLTGSLWYVWADISDLVHPIDKPSEGFSSVLNEGSVNLLICCGVDVAGEEKGAVEITGGSTRVRSFSSEGTNLVFRISVPIVSAAMLSTCAAETPNQ